MSKPMQAIVQHLLTFQIFNIVILDERVIHETPVEQWPRCDALIAYHSRGYPLEKVILYTKIHHPFMPNDLVMQVIAMWACVYIN